MSNSKENDNEQPGQSTLGGMEGEVEQVKEDHDSPPPIIVQDANPAPPYPNSLPVEPAIKITTNEKNIELASIPDQDPPSGISSDHLKESLKSNTEMALDHQKGSVKSNTETTREENNASVERDTEISTSLKAGSVDAPIEALTNINVEANEVLGSKKDNDYEEGPNISTELPEAAEPATEIKLEGYSELLQSKTAGSADSELKKSNCPAHVSYSSACSDLPFDQEKGADMKNGEDKIDLAMPIIGNLNSKQSFLLDENHFSEGGESGTEEEQSAFMKELENFFRERSMEFKPPKFYGEGLNCLKLWRAVTRLGGYDKVTSCKLWRQVGESFKPPKTCTTVSWTFRGFYEKALLDYERHQAHGGELDIPIASNSEPMNVDHQASVSGRARRDAAARAMQGWHSQRLLGNGEVSDPIIKDKNSLLLHKREKQLKNLGLLKRKRPSYMEHTIKAARTKTSKPQLDTTVVCVGPPADWVKINVQRTKDCFEVYALVPGLLREEVRVQSDPAGRLVISGEPEHPDNLWGVTPFKKVVSLPSRIDPHQTSAVVTLHGQLFVRVPFEQSD